jgi:hypothetical protein
LAEHGTMRTASPPRAHSADRAPAWRPLGLAPTSIQGLLQAALLAGAAATPVGAALAPVPGMANWGGTNWGPPPSPPPPPPPGVSPGPAVGDAPVLVGSAPGKRRSTKALKRRRFTLEQMRHALCVLAQQAGQTGATFRSRWSAAAKAPRIKGARTTVARFGRAMLSVGRDQPPALAARHAFIADFTLPRLGNPDLGGKRLFSADELDLLAGCRLRDALIKRSGHSGGGA